jgi:hypothetical protein
VVLSPANYQAMLTGFTGAVQSSNGTAYGAFQGLDFPGGLAGKTGTADTVIGKEPTAWFVGFGPTANPQYVVVCVIDQAGYGATAAAPVVRDIFTYLATHPVAAPVLPPPAAASRSTIPLNLPGAPSTTTPATTVPTAATGARTTAATTSR